MSLYTYHKIEQLQHGLRSAEERYLYDSGWAHSCVHPDHCWRWGKSINDKEYHLPRAEAVRLQMGIDAYDNLLAEEQP